MTDPRNQLEARIGQLERLIAEQLRQLRQRYLLHGAGCLLATIAAAIVIYYAVDRTLDLPNAVRVLVSLGVALLVYREVRARVSYPLRKRLERDDMAVAIERRFPALREGLISAVQLVDTLRAAGTDPHALRNQSPAMIARTVDAATERIASVPVAELFDLRRTTRAWGLAAVTTVALILSAGLNPEAFGVFLGRAFGAGTAYPRLTTLIVELPEGSGEFRIEREGRKARVTLAAGADLPILVRAEGVTPREVFLNVSGGRGMQPRTAMTARSQNRFRHVFRRVQGTFTFSAAGGDDRRGDLDVTVVTLRPPRVETVRATVQPPEYTQQAARTQNGGGVEALVGSRVALTVVPTEDVASARLTFLESGAEVALEPTEVADDAGSRLVYAGSFTVVDSDRYQVRLISSDGLENPDPGTYPVVAVPDHAPTARILSPADDGLGVVLPGALVPFRIRVQDDFGLTAGQIRVSISKVDESSTIDLLAASAASVPARDTIFTRILDTAALAPPGVSIAEGDSIGLGAVFADNREPEPQLLEVPERPVHVVGSADLARRIASHFRRARDEVREVLELQEKLQDRLGTRLDTSGGDADTEPARHELTALQVGQARIQSRTVRLNENFMRAFDLHLFNRLDDSPHTARVLELYVAYHESHPEPEPQLPGFYAMLGEERAAGRLGAMPKVLDPILEMTLSAGHIGFDLAPAAVAQLERSAVSDAAGAARSALEQASALQQRIIAELQRLAARLEEWNEFQDVIIQTRTVLDKQREVQVRTKGMLDGQEGGERTGK